MAVRDEARLLRERAGRIANELAALSADAAGVDPALRARLDAALRALRGRVSAKRNTAILDDPSHARDAVRDFIADELQRYWERRFGRSR